MTLLLQTNYSTNSYGQNALGKLYEYLKIFVNRYLFYVFLKEILYNGIFIIFLVHLVKKGYLIFYQS